MSVGEFISELSSRQGSSTCLVERYTIARDSAGTPVKTWFSHLQTKCAVFIKSGTESIRYGRESNRLTGTFHVPAGQDITGKDRIVYDGRTFDIQAVRTPQERPLGDTLSWTVIEVEETKGVPT